MIVVPFAGLDMYGSLHVITQKDFVKSLIKILDGYLNLAREQSKKHGQIANQLTVVFDMEGFTIKPFLWKPGKTIHVYDPMGAFVLLLFCHFLFYCCLLLVYRYSWRTDHHSYPNVRGKLSGNFKDVLYDQW